MKPSSDVTRDRELDEGSRPPSELLAASREESQRLSGQVQAAREEERARLARELHDALGQMLTALKLDVGWIQRWLAAHQPEAEPLVSRVGAMGTLVDELLAATRLLTRQLRPAAVDDLGLQAAAEALIAEVAGRAGLATALRCDLDAMPRDHEREAVAYRILQEALTNVVRHAGARGVEVSLRHGHGQLELRVGDDGVGLSPGNTLAGTPMGLTGMQERARALGGEVQWARRPAGGTTVTVRLPDRPAPAEDARASGG